MKVGDLVRMQLQGWALSNDDMWGIGLVIEVSDRTPEDVCVFWSKLQSDSWEMIMMLERIDESR